MIMGQPRVAALGVAHFLMDDQEALMLQLTRGTAAIVHEIESNGTDEDRECLHYVLHEAAGSSNKVFPNSAFPRDCDANGIRADRLTSGGEPMRFADFVAHPNSVTSKLSEAHVLALRLYTTACYKSINEPLRDTARRGAHPLAATVFILNTAIKQLRSLNTDIETRSRLQSVATISSDYESGQHAMDLWRGMSNVKVTDSFMAEGGSEVVLAVFEPGTPR